jgi:hypothetical protein
MRSFLHLKNSSILLASMAGVMFAAASARADTNLLTNPGAEDGNLTGWTVGGASNPSVDSGSFDPGINPHSGSYDFYGHTGADGTLSQTVSLGSFSDAAIDAGDTTASLAFWEQGLNQGTPSDDAYVSLTFLNASSAVISSVSTPEVDSHNGTWEEYSDTYTIPAGTRSIEYTMDFVRHAGSDLDAFVDDNSLTVTYANPVLPLPASVWSGGVLLAAMGVWAARRRKVAAI